MQKRSTRNIAVEKINARLYYDIRETARANGRVRSPRRYLIFKKRDGWGKNKKKNTNFYDALSKAVIYDFDGFAEYYTAAVRTNRELYCTTCLQIQMLLRSCSRLWIFNETNRSIRVCSRSDRCVWVKSLFFYQYNRITISWKHVERFTAPFRRLRGCAMRSGENRETLNK